MATGDRVKIITSAQFEPLEQQINDPTTGIATRVENVEQNPTLTLALPYNEAESYQPGYPITRNGVIRVANKNTTGAFKEADWDETGGRTPTSSVVVEDGVGNEVSLSIESGLVTLTVTDGTDTKAFTYSADSGRVNMPNKSTLADAGDSDAVVKEDLEAVVRRAFALADVPVDAKVALIDENGDVNFYDDVDVTSLFKLTQFEFDDSNNRFSQKDEPTATASSNRDMLVKKDGDALYVSQNRPYYTASIDTTVSDGGKIPVTGANVVSNNNEMTLDGTINTITVPSEGVYSVGVVGPIASDSVANNTAFTIDILVNGALTGGFRLREYTNDRLSYQHIGCDVLLPLSAGDNISFKVDGANLFGSANKYTRIKCIYECAK